MLVNKDRNERRGFKCKFSLKVSLKRRVRNKKLWFFSSVFVWFFGFFSWFFFWEKRRNRATRIFSCSSVFLLLFLFLFFRRFFQRYSRTDEKEGTVFLHCSSLLFYLLSSVLLSFALDTSSTIHKKFITPDIQRPSNHRTTKWAWSTNWTVKVPRKESWKKKNQKNGKKNKRQRRQAEKPTDSK